MANKGVFRALIVLVTMSGIPQGISQRVLTLPTVTLKKGTTSTIPCMYERDTFGVHWKKGDTSQSADDLIILDTFYTRGERSGPGYESGRFNITDDYSLVIYDVNIQDGGKYFCEIFDTERLDPVKNSTYVDIIASPRDPFPAFQGCEENEDNDEMCILHTDSALNVTCYVRGVFPDLTLSFQQSINIVAQDESINEDGTKNIFITASLVQSEEPYTCVASHIPGIQGAETAEVLIKKISDEKAVGVIVVATLIPILMVLILVAVLIFYVKKRNRQKSKSDPVEMESQIIIHNEDNDGKGGNENSPLLPNYESVSFVELWELLKRREKDLIKVVPIDEQIQANPEQWRRNELYNQLCQWKDRNESTSVLVEALQAANLDHFIKDYRKDTSSKLSQDIAEHVIWHIPETAKIKMLLEQLGKSTKFDSDIGRKEVVKAAVKKLMEWTTESLQENPVVVLSLALETIGCVPIDREFFTIDSHLMSPIAESEIQRFSIKLAGRHCRRLGEALGIYKPQALVNVIKENQEFLFNTPKMIADWIKEQECSNYEKRCKLNNAVVEAGRSDIQDAFLATVIPNDDEVHDAKLKSEYYLDAGFVFNDELKQIIKYLTKKMGVSLLHELGFESSQPVDNDTIFRLLCKWRDSRDATGTADGIRKKLYKALDATGFRVSVITDDEMNLLRRYIASSDSCRKIISELCPSQAHNQPELDDSRFDILLEWQDTGPQKDKVKRQNLLKAFQKAVKDEVTKAEPDKGSTIKDTSKSLEGDKNPSVHINPDEVTQGEPNKGSTIKDTSNAFENDKNPPVDIEQGEPDKGSNIKDTSNAPEDDKSPPADMKQVTQVEPDKGSNIKCTSNALEDDKNPPVDIESDEVTQAEPDKDSNIKRTSNALEDDNTPPTDIKPALDIEGSVTQRDLNGGTSSTADPSQIYSDDNTRTSEESWKQKETDNFSGAIGQLLDEKTIYEIEVPNIAFNLLIGDILPFVSALQCQGGKLNLPSYKQIPHPEKGTIPFVFSLLDGGIKAKKPRRELAQSFMKIGFIDIARMITIKHEQSMSELLAITTRLSDEDMISLGSKLHLPETDLEKCRHRSKGIDKVEVMRIWKDQVYPQPHDYRAELASALTSMGHDALAGDVLSARLYRTKTVHSYVVDDICERMNDGQKNELSKIFGLKTKHSKNDYRQSIACEQVKQKMKNMKSSEYKDLLKNSFTLRKRSGKSPLHGGWYELAYEMVTLHC